MKVLLERRIDPCPDQLKCTVCNQSFIVPDIRTLLCDNSGLIQGDLCPDCMQLKENGIRQKMKEQSRQRMAQAECDLGRSLSLRQQGLELLSLSQETLTLPSPFQWFMKRMEVRAQEARELEEARLGLNKSCGCGRRSRLRIVFEDD